MGGSDCYIILANRNSVLTLETSNVSKLFNASMSLINIYVLKTNGYLNFPLFFSCIDLEIFVFCTCGRYSGKTCYGLVEVELMYILIGLEWCKLSWLRRYTNTQLRHFGLWWYLAVQILCPANLYTNKRSSFNRTTPHSFGLV